MKIQRGKFSIACLILMTLVILSGCDDKDHVAVYQNSTSSNCTDVTTDKDTNEKGKTDSKPNDESAPEIYIQICGAVNKPGVYKVNSTLRVYEVIQVTGGVTEEAATDAMNLASGISDEMKIYVPSKSEVEEGSYSSDCSNSLNEESKNLNKVNINVASLETLTQLPGIGKSKATAIITYREQNGKFKCIEDIMNINGIKEAAFNKIKDLIVV